MFGSSSSRTSDLASDIDRLRSDVTSLAENVALMLRDGSSAAGSRLSGTGRDVQHDVHRYLDQRLAALGRTGSELAGDARQHLAGANARLESSIGERPIASVLLAAAVGFALGAMSRGRR